MANPLSPIEDLTDHDIDRMVPPRIMRLTQHLHNLIYIRFFYENIGQQPPDWIKGEMARAQTVLLEQLDRENAQGGAFREVEHEARKSVQERSRELESRAEVPHSGHRRRI